MAKKPRRNEERQRALRDQIEQQLRHNDNLFKDIEQSYRGKLEQGTEAIEAEQTLYKLWWDYLRTYREVVRQTGAPAGDVADERIAENFDRFGDLSLPFREWWVRHGRELFQERGELPIIRVVGMDEDFEPEGYPKHITLRIPLTIPAAGIREQLNQLLELCQPKRVMAHRGSTANRRLHPRGAYHRSQYSECLALWKRRMLNPDAPLWLIGHDEGLCPTKNPHSESQSTKDEARRQLDTATKKKLDQADALMHYAVRGEFPKDDEG